MRRVETVIVGGGPAGAATACGLAHLGREVVVVERAHGPHHKVCGEFLSIETQSHLHRLGINPAALGAVEIDRITVCYSTRRHTHGVAVPSALAVALPARRCAAAARGEPRRANEARCFGPVR